MREIELRYQKNVRDLGGLEGYNGRRIKKGRIFRGGFLGRVSDEDIEIINNLHLTDIIDFRGEYEFLGRKDYPFEGVIFHNFPPLQENIKKEHEHLSDANLLWFVSDFDSGHSHMYRMYSTLLICEKGIQAYKNFFKVLLEDDKRVVYFHCSQGKDRAGLAAYLVEIALGVSHEDAKIDYLLSNIAMETKIKHLKNMLKDEPFYNPTYELKLLDVFYAKEDYLNAAIESVIKEYGDFETYLEKVLEVDLNKLRELYLE